MTGPAAKIHLKPDAVPYAQHIQTPILHYWKAQVKASLETDVEQGIFKPVPIGTAITWCSPMVVVSKADGTPCRTVDFQQLSAHCLRETHHTASPFQLVSQVPPNTKKSVLDTVDGFHYVPLNSESQPLATFITEWRQYMCLRMPQAYFAAGDVYTHHYDEIIKDIKQKNEDNDDTLLYNESIKQHFYHVWDYVTLCAKNGIIIHAKNFQFCKDIVDFGGLTITANGVVLSEKMLPTITDIPQPTNLTSACAWFSLVNKVSWAYAVNHIM